MGYQTDLLSIIVPVYNCKKYLNRCIESLIDQSYSNIEIILVDDGSSDGSSDLCDELKKKDKRIRVFHQNNLGPGAARNVGLLNAKGNYITFVDSDDCVEKDGYSKILNQKYKYADIIICQWYTIFENGKVKSSKINNFFPISKEKIIKAVIKYDNKYGGGYPWNKIINWQKIKERTGTNILFEENLKVYEDKCWVLDIFKYADKIAITDIYIYDYYYFNNSLSHSILGTTIKLDAVSRALQHMMLTYKNTIFEKYIDIEIETNKLNRIWYEIKYNYNYNYIQKEWKQFIDNRKYSFFNYSNIMKIKYLLIRLRMLR